MFPQGKGYPDAPALDRLILGDNALVMTSLLQDLEGRLNLIYIDPPFFTNRRYPARIGRGEDSRRPGDWALGEGYEDHWPDLDSYLEFIYPRLELMHRLLSQSGTLYVHLDWHASAYVRLLLDEVFGQDQLLNEIVWTYHGPSPIRRAFNRKHDTLLVYVKGTQYTFNADAVRQPYDPATIRTFKASPRAGFGKVPDLARGKVPEDWWYFPVVARLHKERTGYPTQKPEALLERIVLASSNPGDLVADFFCGSGTAAVVAARTGRRFIAVDRSYRALHTTRRRLCVLPATPFSFEREEFLRFADFSRRRNANSPRSRGLTPGKQPRPGLLGSGSGMGWGRLPKRSSGAKTQWQRATSARDRNQCRAPRARPDRHRSGRSAPARVRRLGGSPRLGSS